MAVASHWLLDVIVRRNDVAILPPFTTQKIGLSIWEYWSRFENFLLELTINLIGMLFIIMSSVGKFKISFWIALILHLVMSIFLTRAIFYGPNSSEMAYTVVDGAPFAPSHALFAVITYAITGVLGYFMDLSNHSQDKSKLQ